MLDVKVVEELVMPYLQEHDLQLYEVAWVKEYGYLMLRVSVDKAGGIDVDTLALVNEYLSSKLDAYESELPEYMLEVCSPGAEKELRTQEEILSSVGMYVNVRTKEMVYEGYLLSYENDELIIEYNVKGKLKKVSIKDNEIKKIRLAVKL